MLVDDDDGYILLYQPYGTATDVADNTTEITTDELDIASTSLHV
jgi:hypothetical protein